MTNPDNVGGLLNAEFSKLMRRMHKHGDSDERYIWDEAIRISGELCRAAPAGGEYRHSTHHVHRGPESLPCYCAGTSDHQIGQETAAYSAHAGSGEVEDKAAWLERAAAKWEVGPMSINPADALRLRELAALLRKLSPAGSGEVSYRWLDELRYQMDHCISAADEGEDYAVPREYLDAMTTLGLMKKVGRGKWAPTEEGEAFAQRKPTLPVNIYGKTYEVPIPVQLHIVALEEAAALLRKLQQGADYVVVPREPTDDMVWAGRDAWTAAHAAMRAGESRYPMTETWRAMLSAASQGQEGGHARD